jgi:hypothetical protein
MIRRIWPTSPCSAAPWLVRARHIDSDADAGPLLDNPPPDADRRSSTTPPDVQAGGWVLVESAVADLPGDLRWLYESGAVTIEQLADLHRALGVTTARTWRGRFATS